MEELVKRLDYLVQKLNIEDKRRRLRELEVEASKPELWQDPIQGQKVMKELAMVAKEIEGVEALIELKEREEWEKLERELDAWELRLFLSGPHDKDDALLAIHAGQGGTEAMDWSEMLFRMYTRYIERQGWSYEEIDRTPGEEAGVKSVTIQVSGTFVYGCLRGERGTHRLVRQSPFNADKLRQTSFALVEVLPIIEDVQEVDIKEEDLEWDFYRASSHGGQNVQKVSSAVRVRHKPTGIIVTCQTQRYQAQNREYALKILRAKLWDLQEEEKIKKEKEFRGEYKTPGWGNQIRSYVLHPYHLVKDLRTGFETTDTEGVLDGEIEGFIEAELRGLSKNTENV